MNKELEALNKLDELCYLGIVGNGEKREYIDIIKSALERKEKLEKAWEIVKEKDVNIKGVNYYYSDYSLYNFHMIKADEKYRQLTETEFNLLKEMLEEKNNI